MQRAISIFLVSLAVCTWVVQVSAGPSVSPGVQLAQYGRGVSGDKLNEVMENMDLDDDGLLSKQEFRGPPQQFDFIDTDKDGFISSREFGAFRDKKLSGKQGGSGPSVEKFMGRMDKDGDGRVAREEFTGPKQKFQHLDADGDGFITRDELAQGLARKGGAGGKGKGSKAKPPPIIFTHVHMSPGVGSGNAQFDDWDSTIKSALKDMDEIGVRTAILMPTPRPAPDQGPADDGSQERFLDELFSVAKQHPDRFRVAGGGWTLNGMIDQTAPEDVDASTRRKFTEIAEDIIRRGAIGFGETTALHFSVHTTHPFEETQPDHPLFLLLADLAAKHDVPLDIHVEAVVEKKWEVSPVLKKFSEHNPNWADENITAFERLLAHNPKAKIIWVHLGMDLTGQRTVALTRRLLRKYANLFLSVTSNQGLTKKNWFFKPGAGLNPRWLELIIEFPDRFMIGSDVFFQPDNANIAFPQKPKMAANTVLKPFLPPRIRRMVAYGNAQRVFKLNIIAPQKPPGGMGAMGMQRPGMGGMGMQRPGMGKKKFLSWAEIRRVIAGNTLSFTAPSNGRNLFIYFGKDGRIAMKQAGKGKKIIHREWFINTKTQLCRTFGRNNRKHCTRVFPTDDPNTLMMRNKKIRYRATLLMGRQLNR
jgi:predicted TIM-barrel fold metal-dependent hydrolase/Ca2+-binding EF-hand superfamily protein